MSPDASSRPVALVTGAARGIGRACALALAGEGFRLVLNDLDDADSRAALDDAAAALAAHGTEAAIAPADLADLATHSTLLRAALHRWGRLDCLVNNAGVGVLRRGDLLEVTPESFDRCHQVNTRAVFFLTQTVARHMLEHPSPGGHPRSIITITSSNAVAVSVTRGEYCVSKCASGMTVRLFAARLAEAGIGVFEIRPGIIDTEMTRPAKERYDQLIAEGLVPARRWGTPADVAAAVAALASGRLPYTVGQAITVDGGLTMPRF